MGVSYNNVHIIIIIVNLNTSWKHNKGIMLNHVEEIGGDDEFDWGGNLVGVLVECYRELVWEHSIFSDLSVHTTFGDNFVWPACSAKD